ncbi:hypothetical protein GUITHDRAFT_162191 [Guillardia theta CCMP2712]|uniref:Uncharacterized protein n=1 Tax=Guillardia theta (strain CCMP2712) TaxID=905079 RepID=L1JMG8_GUITC|nr:hypothetical protein GUITHDRAFT_162191 [Guillardia theta CCMP2712]EKX49464.1 hypothetical protein GUITHDRAFT_162191 [Guillardia theta CCMP2712]|eukprot:XP_005836444.1 hypothetical protein GUITHDRAFT_162191 [Guillardia theta CCMP2712]
MQQGMELAASTVWVRGQHLTGNGVMLSKSRIITSRQIVFTYHEATLSEVDYLDQEEGVVFTTACDPSSCFLSNQRLDMTIVGVDPEFCNRCKLQPVTVHDGRLARGNEVVMVSKLGGAIEEETTIATRLVVEEVGESEVFLSPVDDLTSGVLGSPIFKDKSLVAIVVKLKQEEGGLRALMIETVLDKLKKRQQLEHALGADGNSSSNGIVEQRVRTKKISKLKRMLGKAQSEANFVGIAAAGAVALTVVSLVVVFLRWRR